MKILHLPSTFFPLYTGGKEVFVYQLARYMPQAEHRILIHRGETSETYLYNGLRVDVLPKEKEKDRTLSYYSWIYDDLHGFEDYLNDFQPDLVHFHDQGQGASLSHLRVCKRKGIKTVLSYHSPGQSCLQRSLLFKGRIPCDGLILTNRCTYCRYTIRGVPEFLGKIVSAISLPVDTSGRFILRNSTKYFHQSWAEFYNAVDLIQVHADWVKHMLVRNSIPEDKIAYVKLGGHTSLKKQDLPQQKYDQPLKLVFVGRCIDIKGVHLLIEAIKSLPNSLNIEVHFFGPYWDDSAYGLRMQNMVQGDARFKKPRLISPDKVIGELSTMDLCIIPSVWPETGPFTVLDAFAAKLPVIGADLAGISERIHDGINGLLFKWNDSMDLAGKLRWLTEDRSRIGHLKSNIPDNYTFSQMSEAFYELYTTVIKNEYR